MNIKINKKAFGSLVTAIICLSLIFFIIDLGDKKTPTQEHSIIENVDNFEPLPKVEESKETYSIKRMGISEVELRDFHKSRVHWNIDIEVKCVPSQKSEVIEFVLNSINTAATSEYGKFNHEEWSELWTQVDKQAEYVFQDIVYNKNNFSGVSFNIKKISYDSMSY